MGSAELKRRRSEIWVQIAQVYRACGDLDMAEERLGDAITCLKEVLVERSASDISGFRDCLHDAQTTLASICVQQEDYVRAEALYLEAFDESSHRLGARECESVKDELGAVSASSQHAEVCNEPSHSAECKSK